MFYYSPNTNGFYDSRLHGDNVPKDSIKLTDNEYVNLKDGVSNGKIVELGADGRPMLCDRPPQLLTREDIEALRLHAYADPLTGSDRYFAEAQRMQAMGEEGWQVVREQGVSRYQEIQSKYPWNQSVQES